MNNGRSRSTTRITKAFVDAATSGDASQALYWDTKTPGFGLRVGKNAKTFICQHEVGGRSVRRSLGRYSSSYTVEQARKDAQDYLHNLRRGVDPKVEEEKCQQAAIAEAERQMTLRQAWQAFQQEDDKRADKTKRRYRQIMETYFAGWMDRPLRGITKDDVRQRHLELAREIASGKYAQRVAATRRKRKGVRAEPGHAIAPADRCGKHTANDAFRLFRTIWNHAADVREDLPKNPVSVLRKRWFKPVRPRTALTSETLPVWYAGTSSIENPVRRDYLRFVLFTGLRKVSAAEVRWRDVDLKQRTLFIPKPKGGASRAFMLPLSDYLVTLLERRKTDNERLAADGVIPAASEWVFPSWSASGHIEEPREEIEGVRATVHDLRRTYITVASKIDTSIYKVRLLVNHALPKNDVTAGYADIDLDDLRGPQQRITDHLLKIINRGTESDTGNVLSFTSKENRG